jgi:protein-L-isoaspartate(D-aspartate) O-methyltransferase
MIVVLAAASTGCPKRSESPDAEPVEKTATQPAKRLDAGEERLTEPSGKPTREERMRHDMVERHIVARGVTDRAVIDAMRKIPRHEFVPDEHRHRAYADAPSPIGHRQTISQPYVVAAMTELLDVEKGDKVLEIGTGSGYQAAVLAEIGVKLYTIEIICDLAERAEKTLDRLGYSGVHVRCGDGYKGWPSEAPFDGVIVTAAPPEIPQALIEQLALGGRMVVPVGEHIQSLLLIRKKPDGSITKEKVADVRFVPMVHGDEEESAAE